MRNGKIWAWSSTWMDGIGWDRDVFAAAILYILGEGPIADTGSERRGTASPNLGDRRGFGQLDIDLRGL